MSDPILDQILDKARTAQAGSFGVLSTGEKLAVAPVLNRPDWLQSMRYTFGEAVTRLGPEWIERVPPAERILRDEADADAARPKERSREEGTAHRSITELDFVSAHRRERIRFDYCVEDPQGGDEPVVQLLALRDEPSANEDICSCRIRLSYEHVRQITRSLGEAEVVSRGIMRPAR